MLDDLGDIEILGMLVPLRQQRPRPAAARAWAALVNELTSRAQARGLYDEGAGALTERGLEVLRDGVRP